MKLFNMEERYFRKSLEGRRFFEGVIFEDRESKNAISNWIFRLWKYRNVHIGKFIHIFEEMCEITFPIKIKKDSINSRYAKISIKDVKGTKYTMRVKMNNAKIEEYLIFNTESERYSEKRWLFKFIEPSQTILKEIYEKPLNNSNEQYEREYVVLRNKISNTINAIAEWNGGTKSVQIAIDSGDLEEVDIIMSVLENIDFNRAEKDVLNIFKMIMEATGRKRGKISVRSFVNDNQSSEIVANKGMVTKYSFTRCLEISEKIITQEEMPYLEIESFIRKNHYRL